MDSSGTVAALTCDDARSSAPQPSAQNTPCAALLVAKVMLVEYAAAAAGVHEKRVADRG